MADSIENTENIIDSRDVIERIEELAALIEGENADADAFDDDDVAELAALRALAVQGEGLGDWIHGETLIRDDHFEDYAQELADDLGLVSGDVQWPYTCIDWDQAARELRMDYTSIEFDGVTYWGR